MSVINKKTEPIETRWKNLVIKNALKFGLYNLAEIARYLGYKERTFQAKIKHFHFTGYELIEIISRLKFEEDEVGDFFLGVKR